MILYYRNLPVVLISENEHIRTVRLGGGEEVVVPRDEVHPHADYEPEAKAPYEEPREVHREDGEPGTDVEGRPFPIHQGD